MDGEYKPTAKTYMFVNGIGTRRFAPPAISSEGIQEMLRICLPPMECIEILLAVTYGAAFVFICANCQ